MLHRDIKPGNILLFEEGSHCKIADYGISKFILADLSGKITGNKGTNFYLSPERLSRYHYQKNDPALNKSDVWALGCVMLQTCMNMKGIYEQKCVFKP